MATFEEHIFLHLLRCQRRALLAIASLSHPFHESLLASLRIDPRSWNSWKASTMLADHDATAASRRITRSRLRSLCTGDDSDPAAAECILGSFRTRLHLDEAGIGANAHADDANPSTVSTDRIFVSGSITKSRTSHKEGDHGSALPRKPFSANIIADSTEAARNDRLRTEAFVYDAAHSSGVANIRNTISGTKIGKRGQRGLLSQTESISLEDKEASAKGRIQRRISKVTTCEENDLLHSSICDSERQRKRQRREVDNQACVTADATCCRVTRQMSQREQGTLMALQDGVNGSVRKMISNCPSSERSSNRDSARGAAGIETCSHVIFEDNSASLQANGTQWPAGDERRDRSGIGSQDISDITRTMQALKPKKAERGIRNPAVWDQDAGSKVCPNGPRSVISQIPAGGISQRVTRSTAKMLRSAADLFGNGFQECELQKPKKKKKVVVNCSVRKMISNCPSSERPSNGDSARGAAGIETCSPVITVDNTASLHANGIQLPAGDGMRDLSVIGSQDISHINLSMQAYKLKNPEAETGIRTPAIRDQDAGSKSYPNGPRSVISQIPSGGISQRVTRSKAKMLRSAPDLFGDGLQEKPTKKRKVVVFEQENRNNCNKQLSMKSNHPEVPPEVTRHFCNTIVMGDPSSIKLSSDKEQETISFVENLIELNKPDHNAGGNVHIKTPISLVQGRKLVQVTEAVIAAQNTDFLFALPSSKIQTSPERFEDSHEEVILASGEVRLPHKGPISAVVKKMMTGCQKYEEVSKSQTSSKLPERNTPTKLSCLIHTACKGENDGGVFKYCVGCRICNHICAGYSGSLSPPIAGGNKGRNSADKTSSVKSLPLGVYGNGFPGLQKEKGLEQNKDGFTDSNSRSNKRAKTKKGIVLKCPLLIDISARALTSPIVSINSKLKDEVDHSDIEKLSGRKLSFLPAVSSSFLMEDGAGVKGQVETSMPTPADKEPSDAIPGEKLDTRINGRSSIKCFMISGSHSKYDSINAQQLQGSHENMSEFLHIKACIGLEFVASGQQAKETAQKATSSSSSQGDDHFTHLHIRDTDKGIWSSDLNHPLIHASCSANDEITATKQGNLTYSSSKDISCVSAHRKYGSLTPVDAKIEQERGASKTTEECDEGVDLHTTHLMHITPPSRLDSQELLGAGILNYDHNYDNNISPNTAYPLHSDDIQTKELDSLRMEQLNKSILQGRVNSSRRKRARLSSMDFDFAKVEFRGLELSPDRFKWSNTFASPVAKQNYFNSQMVHPPPGESTERLCAHGSWTSIQKYSGTSVNENCYHGFSFDYGKKLSFEGFMGQIGDGREMLTGHAGLNIEKQGHKRPLTPALSNLYERDFRVGGPNICRDISNNLCIEEESYSEEKENKLSRSTKPGSLSSRGCRRTKTLRESSRVNQAAPSIERASSLVQQNPFSRGKRAIKVKSLGAALTTKKQDRNRKHEQEKWKLEPPKNILLGKKSNEAFGAMACKHGQPTEVPATYSCQRVSKSSLKENLLNTLLMPALSGCTSKAQGLKKGNRLSTVKRRVELKLKLDQQKAKVQELQRRKEEKRKQKEVELATRKREREEAEKMKHEQRKRRFENVQQSRKEHEEQQHLYFEGKDQKKKAVEEHKYGRMAAKENKRPHSIKTEKETKQRRKTNLENSVSFLAGREAVREQMHILNQKEEMKEAKRSASTLLVQSNFRVVKKANSDVGPQSYEISPYRGSDDEEEEKVDRSKKPIPLWARKENLLPQLEQQQYMDPDVIFQNDKTCSLEEIFQRRNSKKQQGFSRRSGSGDWLQDLVTWKEDLEYKRSMGYII